MVKSMERMKQTYKTIIFEEFNTDEDSLYDLLSITEEPRTEKFAQEVKNLEVHSFKAFLEKFAPKVYEVCRFIDGKPSFFYTTDKEKVRNMYAVEMKITDHMYYKMLAQLYSEKGGSGKSNLQFDDASILDMLTPAKEVQEARNIRKQLQLSYDKYQECQKNGENGREYAKKILAYRKAIVRKYKDSKSAMMPLAIEDLKTKILYLNKPVSSKDEMGNQLVSGEYTGILDFDSEGKLIVARKKIEALPAPETADAGEASSHAIANIIQQDYTHTVKEEENDFVKNLVISTYSPMNQTDNLPANLTSEEIEGLRQQYIAQKDVLEEIYCQAKQAFICEMTAVIEKLLGVKAFFDHAAVNGGNDGELQEGVIITNCKASQLLDDSVRDKFEKYMRYMGKDQIDQKIWFALLPGIQEDDGVADDDPEIDPFGDLSDADDGSRSTETFDKVSLSAARNILGIMDQSHIMTVFNFKADEKNGFSSINEQYVMNKEKQLESIHYAHAVFAYPNFTLMRERTISLEPQGGSKGMTIPGAYIDAAYPAVGLLAASQQQPYLEKLGLTVNKQNVCAHVDLEDTRLKTKLLTKFNRESTLRWGEDIKKAITNSMFGFVFCGDKVYDDTQGTEVNNTYVECARTLHKTSSGFYKAIHKVLTEDFICQYWKTKNSKKISDVDLFIKQEVRTWMDEAKQKDHNQDINFILRENEYISWDSTNNKMKIKFQDEEAVIDDIDISSEE